MNSLSLFNDIHTHQADAPETSLISIRPFDRMRPDRFYSVGVHPWDTSDRESARRALDHLAAMLPLPQVAAIGECGLDALRGGSEEFQETVFTAQALIAEQYHLPLIIHCVRRFDSLIKIRRQLKPKSEWIIHGFRGKPQQARQLLNDGFSLSFGKKYNPESLALTPPSQRYRESDTTQDNVQDATSGLTSCV